mmetsp:Transcript_5085/g.9464  ORF Transcript_5085/g.9464 Transcript_5085/m.9464 type:complete len:203 (+) Transcript_5085:36-644(+)
MSIVVSTPQQIHDAPTNASSAKQLFSFPKADRFTKPSKDINEAFYNSPNSLEKRTTSFGYGNKYDFTKERGRDIPPPNAYTMPSDFDQGRPFSSAFSFGISRESCEKRYIEGHFRPDPSVPGPGTYTATKGIGKDAVAYSMRARTATTDQLFLSHKGPGPGAYRPKVGLDKEGKYVLSSFRSSGACSFSPKTSQRFRPPSKP